MCLSGNVWCSWHCGSLMVPWCPVAHVPGQRRLHHYYTTNVPHYNSDPAGNLWGACSCRILSILTIQTQWHRHQSSHATFLNEKKFSVKTQLFTKLNNTIATRINNISHLFPKYCLQTTIKLMSSIHHRITRETHSDIWSEYNELLCYNNIRNSRQ